MSSRDESDYLCVFHLKARTEQMAIQERYLAYFVDPPELLARHFMPNLISQLQDHVVVGRNLFSVNLFDTTNGTLT